MSRSQVIFENNTAIAFIDAQEYHEAISLLSRSLKNYYSEGRDTDIRPVSTDEEETENSQPTKLDRCMVSRLHSSFNDDRAYMYDNPVRMPATLVEPTSNRRSTIASILIFNLALAHHLLSLQPRNVSKVESSLEVAMTLYELALELQTSKKFFDSNYMYVLATLNNIALIRQQQNQEKLAKKGFAQVFAILMFMMDSGVVQGEANLDGFYYNAASFGGDCIIRGAAAA
eukprot:scaffold26160_cov103-Cylindrotheca_fusiformis.AAC.1